jgi:hypothetical protein
MYEIRKTPQFDEWLNGIQDSLTIKRLSKRLSKVALGNFGDVSPISDGVWEMREHFGAGWRMYYIQYGRVIIVMLGGGCKATQVADIKEVKKIARSLEA